MRMPAPDFFAAIILKSREPGASPGSRWELLAAGGTVAVALLIRAEAIAEQVQLQLEGQFQPGHGCQNTLYAFVDLHQTVHIDVVHLSGFFDFFVLRFQNAGQRFLLIGYSVDQFGDGSFPAVVGTGRRGLYRIPTIIVLSW